MKLLLKKFYHRYPYTCLLLGILLVTGIVFSLPPMQRYFRIFSDEIIDDPKFYLNYKLEILEDGKNYYIETYIPADEMERFTELVQNAHYEHESFYIGRSKLPNGDYYQPSLALFQVELFHHPLYPDDDFFTRPWHMPASAMTTKDHFRYQVYHFAAIAFGWTKYATGIMWRLFWATVFVFGLDLTFNLWHEHHGTKRRVRYRVHVGAIVIIVLICFTCNLKMVDELYAKYCYLDEVATNYQANFIEGLILRNLWNVNGGVREAISDLVFQLDALLIFMAAMVCDNVRRVHKHSRLST